MSKKQHNKKITHLAAKARIRKYISYVARGYSNKEAAIKAGFSPNYTKTVRFKKTKSWKEILDQALPDELLLAKTRQGLEATRPMQLVERDADGRPVYETKMVPDFQARHKYLETSLKLKDRFPRGEEDGMKLSFSLSLLARKAAQIRELSENDIHPISEGEQLPEAKIQPSSGIFSGIAKLEQKQ